MLTGKSTEERIWNYLGAAGLNACGAAGLMGNLYAESGLIPTNLQNAFEKRLGYTDAAYTAAVDGGAYTNFAKDGAGYGLAQWTYHTRKAALLAFAKAAGKSVGDLETQLDFLMKELRESFQAVLSTLKTATSVRAASDAVLTRFERPANMGEAVQTKRAGYGQAYYDKYATNREAEKGSDAAMGYTNSPLASFTKISPNRTSPRNHAIDTITIHCFVGQVTARSGCGAKSFTTYDAKDGIPENSSDLYGELAGLLIEEHAERAERSRTSERNRTAIFFIVASPLLRYYKMCGIPTSVILPQSYLRNVVMSNKNL